MMISIYDVQIYSEGVPVLFKKGTGKIYNCTGEINFQLTDKDENKIFDVISCILCFKHKNKKFIIKAVLNTWKVNANIDGSISLDFDFVLAEKINL